MKDRLLVVDDVPDNRFLLRTILAEEGHEILEAESGKQALAILQTDLPDLVLLDVMMPDIDGYEVTRRIRALKDIPFIPILLITAHDQSSAVKGLDLGADEFLRKPVQVDELLARVRSLLRLKHSIEERDRIAQQRQDFVSRLTHDLRTPLVAADRMLGLLQDGALGELSTEVKEALEIMARSNHNLLEMVNKLLDVYRYEGGNKKLNPQALDLAELVRQVVEELGAIARTKNLELTTDIPDNLPRVKGDRLELLRVFNNIVGNALKFTEVGSVRVSLYQKGKELVATVADTGPGIPAADRAMLFQRFHQGSHQKQGSGLGLYLSYYIVAAHEGRISLECPPSGGSCFSIYLPL